METEVHIEVDVDCKLFIFNNYKTMLFAHVDNVVKLNIGRYKLDFVSSEYTNVKVSQVYSLLTNLYSDYINISMGDEVANEKKRIQEEERRKAQELQQKEKEKLEIEKRKAEEEKKRKLEAETQRLREKREKQDALDRLDLFRYVNRITNPKVLYQLK